MEPGSDDASLARKALHLMGPGGYRVVCVGPPRGFRTGDAVHQSQCIACWETTKAHERAASTSEAPSPPETILIRLTAEVTNSHSRPNFSGFGSTEVVD